VPRLRSRQKASFATILVLCLGWSSRATAQFETRASVGTGSYYPTSCVVGDFNRDGKLDVAVVSYLPQGNVTIYLGNGDGTFRTGASYLVATQPSYAATTSFRKNGILDIVVGDTLSDYIYVMLGNGDGTFKPAVSYPAPARPANVSVGDFNGDGKIDILALTGPGGVCSCLAVFLGNGDGTFGSALVTTVPYDVDGFEMTTGDFDEDGKLDVAVTAGFGSTNQVDILLGNGDGTFRPHGFYPVSEGPDSIAAGHFNSDNKTDLAVGNYNGSTVGVLLGKANGAFRQAVNYTAYFPTWVTVGDMNGDGKEDLVVSNIGSTSNLFISSVSVLSGNGDGTFGSAADYLGGEQDEYVAIGDFNGDHKPDLVVVDDLGHAVITLLNTGVVSFSPTTPLDFTPQLIGTTSAPRTVTLTNNGTAPLTISSVSYSGPHFRAQTTCHGNIAPGAACTIKVTVTPQSEDIVTGMITIVDSASSKPQVIEVSGVGTVVKFAPDRLTFPSQKVGTQSAPQTITLTNTGSSTLNFTNKIYINGADGKTFTQTNNCPTSLPAGSNCTIAVVFAPKQTGPHKAIVVASDDGGGLMQSVPITGVGD
jgi:hypothetical protein